MAQRVAQRRDRDARRAGTGTRGQILSLIVSDGPISAQDIAARLDLAAAGIRRHLSGLLQEGLIEAYQLPGAERGRGRPARHFVAAREAQGRIGQTAGGIAVEAIEYVAELGGPAAVREFADRRADGIEQRYQAQVSRGGPDAARRARALVEAMARDGYAATLRPGPGGTTLQICQGHCPIHEVAARFPELCEAETAAISRLLGRHVLRLATLADGEHVCTTCVPLALAAGAGTTGDASEGER
ncbi:MAG: winged helix-turn-helix transcriptional regulator [Bifidobacteriaceae bacterium]|nr:winged helix-turn-helix transcriptional regulator [Bifidobacteriaceae bacterium]